MGSNGLSIMATHSADDAPYLSLVVAAHNDGDSAAEDFARFREAWSEESARQGLASEIIAVGWSAPEKHARDTPAIQAKPNSCAMRVIEIPEEVQSHLEHSDGAPQRELIAKNAGIRRARGEYVLATSPGAVFSPELVQFLAERRLERGRLYRIDRRDVAGSAPAGPGVDELLKFAMGRVARVRAREGDYKLAGDGLRAVEESDIVRRDAGIRLGAGWHPLDREGGEPFRWIGSEAEIVLRKPDAVESHLLLDVEAGPSAAGKTVLVEITDTAGSEPASAAVENRRRLRLHFPASISNAVLRLRVQGGGAALDGDARLLDLRVFGLSWEPSWFLETLAAPVPEWAAGKYAISPLAAQMRNPAFLHTNACGDFLLLARDDWFALRGFAEFAASPAHIEALFCYAAHHAGIQEVILREPLRLFHFGDNAEAAESSAEAERVDLMKCVEQMRRFDAPLIFRRNDWGLGGEVLEEAAL